MSARAHRAPPDKRKTRPFASGRASKCQLGGDGSKDNRSALGAQLLRCRFNIAAPRADLLSSLIWGEPA